MPWPSRTREAETLAASLHEDLLLAQKALRPRLAFISKAAR